MNCLSSHTKTLPEIKLILADVVSKAIENNIEIILSNKDRVVYSGDSSNTECAGYFCENEKTGERILAVATDVPLKHWITVLLHESSHMDQYLENCQEWQDCKMEDGSDSTDALFKWIDGANIDNIYDIGMRSLRVELDCEKRTVKKIMDYNLYDHIDVIEYIKKANAYIYFYLYVLETRKFYTKGNEPYTNSMIWSVAPVHFQGDYSTIPQPLYDAFKEYI